MRTVLKTEQNWVFIFSQYFSTLGHWQQNTNNEDFVLLLKLSPFSASPGF